MTQSEKFCPLHGPYDANLLKCPYCEMESTEADEPLVPPPAEVEDASPSHAWIGEEAIPLPATFGDGEVIDENIFTFEEDAPRQEPPKSLHTAILERKVVKSDEPTLLGIFWVKTGTLRGKIFPLQHGTVIGRTHGEVSLADPAVSDPHAKLTMEEHHFVIWDFGSSNGTFVNGEKIRAATVLKENDEIRFGNTIVILKTLQ